MQGWNEVFRRQSLAMLSVLARQLLARLNLGLTPRPLTVQLAMPRRSGVPMMLLISPDPEETIIFIRDKVLRWPKMG